MIKRLLTKLALWILDGQYVPATLLARAEEDLYQVRLLRYNEQKSSSKEFVQWAERAIRAEFALDTHVCPQNYTENVQTSPQIIDIRVPRKVLR